MTRSQQMLGHAHSRIANRPVSKEYRTVVLGAAAMIQSAGLAQAVAFFAAKANKEEAYRQLIEDLEKSPAVGEKLVERASKASAGDYMRLTRLVTQQLLYLKRMAISYYQEKAPQEKPNA